MANVNSNTLGGGNFVIFKPSIEERVYTELGPESGTPVDDPDFQWDVKAGEVWQFELHAAVRMEMEEGWPLGELAYQWATPDVVLLAFDSPVGALQGATIVGPEYPSPLVTLGQVGTEPEHTWGIQQQGTLEANEDGTVAFQWSLATYSFFEDLTPNPITGASNEPSILITEVGHGRTTNDRVRIEEVEGNTAANGTWLIIVIDADHYSLDGASGDGDYTTGGVAIGLQPPITITNLANSFLRLTLVSGV
jgi:hypothetical protein